MNHLIIVPGHGIWKGTHKGEHQDDWHLESFQKEGNDHLIFVQHIETAMRIADSDLNAAVIFTGGMTKSVAGRVSEGGSYYSLAKELIGRLDVSGSVMERCYTEEYARDSFENVLFSIARFKQITTSYPARITITGFEFKRHRFMNLHLKTLQFDMEHVGYFGIDPQPPYDRDSKQRRLYFEDLKRAEYKHAVVEFEKDPLGNGPVLGAKKRSRNPFGRAHQYEETVPELELFFGDFLRLNGVITPWSS